MESFNDNTLSAYFPGLVDVCLDDDGYTYRTADGLPSAHFEHSIVIREDGPEVLSTTPKMAWGQTL